MPSKASPFTTFRVTIRPSCWPPTTERWPGSCRNASTSAIQPPAKSQRTPVHSGPYSPHAGSLLVLSLFPDGDKTTRALVRQHICNGTVPFLKDLDLLGYKGEGKYVLDEVGLPEPYDAEGIIIGQLFQRRTCKELNMS